MNENLKSALKIIEIHHESVKQEINHWFSHELFTWNWWILLSFMVMPSIFLVKVVDRTRLLEILLFGTLVIILTSTLDAIGIDLKYWVYPVQFIPLTFQEHYLLTYLWLLLPICCFINILIHGFLI